MSFKDLIGALGTLSKAQGIDNAENVNIAGVAAGGEANDGANAGGEGAGGTQAQAAAAGGAEGQGSGQGEGGAAQVVQVAGDGQAAALVKSLTSFEVTVGDETFEGADASEILKSLTNLAGHIDDSEGQIKTALGQAVIVMGTQSQQINDLTKSLAGHGTLVAEQANLIKSLRDDLDGLRNSPSGRISVTNPAQLSGASPLAKSLQLGDGKEGLPPQEFLAKCLSLQKTGAMSLQDVAIAEASIGSGVPVPSHITAKVFSKQ